MRAREPGTACPLVDKYPAADFTAHQPVLSRTLHLKRVYLYDPPLLRHSPPHMPKLCPATPSYKAFAGWYGGRRPGRESRHRSGVGELFPGIRDRLAVRSGYGDHPSTKAQLEVTVAVSEPHEKPRVNPPSATTGGVRPWASFAPWLQGPVPRRFTVLFELDCWICQNCGRQTSAALGGPQASTRTLPAKQAPATASPRS